MVSLTIFFCPENAGSPKILPPPGRGTLDPGWLGVGRTPSLPKASPPRKLTTKPMSGGRLDPPLLVLVLGQFYDHCL